MKLLKSVVALSLLILMACTNAGIQGTELFSRFVGAESAKGISPTAIKVSWSLDGGYTEYRVYVNDSVIADKTETFSSTIISSLQPDTEYTFRVTGVDKEGAEVAIGSNLSARTFANFTGVGEPLQFASSAAGAVDALIEVVWDYKANTSGYSADTQYKVFKKLKTGAWTPTTPETTATNAGRYSVSLGMGLEYCFFVQAYYEDGTSEPTLTTPASNTTQTEMDAGAKCHLVKDSEIKTQVTLASSIGPYPWFRVMDASSVNTAGQTVDYSVNIFDVNSGVLVTTGVGNGIYKSSVSHKPGIYFYDALISYQLDGVSRSIRVPVVMNLSDTTVAPVRVRSLQYEDTANSNYAAYAALQSPLLNEGKGRQRFGSQAVSGDFNCDGYTDLAVSMPIAVPDSTVMHYTDTGAVVVYYGKQNLSTFAKSLDLSNPQTIKFTVAENDRQFGYRLAVGNLNGDCRKDGAASRMNCNNLYQEAYDSIQVLTPARFDDIRSCDDLIIGTKVSSVYVIYGANTQLNAGDGSFYLTNELTCESSSNTCSPVRINGGTYFGQAITTGDYNNDGFDDVALRDSASSVVVLRGSINGMSTYLNKISITGPASTDFGYSLGTAYNSKNSCGSRVTPSSYSYSANGISSGYDFEKCDELIIGAPGYASNTGAVYYAASPITGTQNLTVPYQPAGGVIAAGNRFGSVVYGSRNHNGEKIVGSPPAVNDIRGSLFVSAPAKAEGVVYAYHTSAVVDGTGSAIKYALTTATATNRQTILMPTPESGAQFGSSITAFTLKSNSDNHNEYAYKALAIGAPGRTIKSFYTPDILNAGTVYVFKPDTAGGVASPGVSASASVFKMSSPTASADFGSSVVGGEFSSVNASDEMNDLIVGVPGALGMVAGAAKSAESGAAFIFKQDLTGFSPTVDELSAGSEKIEKNIGKENTYNFEDAKVIGDINQDGFSDIVTHVNDNGVWKLFVYYGSADGLKKSIAPSEDPSGTNPLTIKSVTDKGFGKRFYPIGDVNGDMYADMLVIGDEASYVYYGSESGYKYTTPVISPSGKEPLKFATKGSNKISFESYVENSATSYNIRESQVTFGKYNNDDYGDFAISYPGTSTATIFVFFGSDSGLSVDNSSGYILTSDADPTKATATTCSNTIIALKSGCLFTKLVPSDGALVPATSVDSKFGFSMATFKNRKQKRDMLVASGSDKLYFYYYPNTSTSEAPVTAVQAVASTGNIIQIMNAGDVDKKDGEDLVVVTDLNVTLYKSRGISSNYLEGFDFATSTFIQTILPTAVAPAQYLGWGVSALDLNKDGFSDIVINVPDADSAQGEIITGGGYVSVLFGSDAGLASTTNMGTRYPTASVVGGVKVQYPYKIFMPDATPYERTTISPYSVGDINGDGKQDLMIGVPGRDLSVSGVVKVFSAGALYILY